MFVLQFSKNKFDFFRRLSAALTVSSVPQGDFINIAYSNLFLQLVCYGF